MSLLQSKYYLKAKILLFKMVIAIWKVVIQIFEDAEKKGDIQSLGSRKASSNFAGPLDGQVWNSWQGYCPQGTRRIAVL